MIVTRGIQRIQGHYFRLSGLHREIFYPDWGWIILVDADAHMRSHDLNLAWTQETLDS